MSKKGANDAVKVMVRVRPFNQKEISEANEEGLDLPICTLQCPNETTIVAIDHRADVITMEDQEAAAAFGFDYVFWSMTQVEAGIPFSGQTEVYSKVGEPVLDVSFEGFNVSIFAYGQTSSGKTHTMMGGHGPSERGIIPRLCEDLFEKISTEDRSKVQTTVKLAYLEIYNEKIQDLLPDGKVKKSVDKKVVASPRSPKGAGKAPTNEAPPSPRSPKKDDTLHIYYDPEKGPIVNGLAVHDVASWRAVQKLLDLGNSNRSTAATQMNDRSSRSHAIVQLTVSRSFLVGVVATKELWKAKHSRINLVDLAGSEKVRKSGVTGVGMKESIGINQSLTCLGRVIDLLCERKQGEHIPYRDSTLTGLLSDSLGGNSRTTMLAALSPAAVNFDETLSTLRYAARARKIINVVKVNTDPTQALIESLRQEIRRLRTALGTSDSIDKINGDAGMVEELEAVESALKLGEGEDEAQAARLEEEWRKERESLQKKHESDLESVMSQKEQLLKQAEETRLKLEQARAEAAQAGDKLGITSAKLKEMVESYEELKRMLGADKGDVFEQMREQIRKAEKRIKELEAENEELRAGNNPPKTMAGDYRRFSQILSTPATRDIPSFQSTGNGVEHSQPNNNILSTPVSARSTITSARSCSPTSIPPPAQTPPKVLHPPVTYKMPSTRAAEVPVPSEYLLGSPVYSQVSPIPNTIWNGAPTVQTIPTYQPTWPTSNGGSPTYESSYHHHPTFPPSVTNPNYAFTQPSIPPLQTSYTTGYSASVTYGSPYRTSPRMSTENGGHPLCARCHMPKNRSTTPVRATTTFHPMEGFVALH